jgi:hypothetical protein
VVEVEMARDANGDVERRLAEAMFGRQDDEAQAR